MYTCVGLGQNLACMIHLDTHSSSRLHLYAVFACMGYCQKHNTGNKYVRGNGQEQPCTDIRTYVSMMWWWCSAESGYSRGLPAGSPGPREGRASEWTTPDQIGTTHHTLGPQ